MTPSRTQPRSSLSRCLDVASGIDASAALSRAELHIDGLRYRAIEEVGRACTSIAEAAAEAPSEERIAKIAECASRITSVAGFVDMEPVGRAAGSLGALAADAGPDGCIDEEVLGVHVKALARLRRPEGLSPDAINGMIEGLDQISRRAKVRAPEGGRE